MDTSVVKNEYNEQAFLTGIALEICKRNQSEEQAEGTAEPFSVEGTDSHFSREQIFFCDSLYTFHMKKKISYYIASMGDWSSGWEYENIEPPYDSSSQTVRYPVVCILPPHSRRPLLYINNVPDEIREYLIKAISLAQKHFPMIMTLDVQSEQDPETGEEWTVLEITVEGDIEQILNCYDNYTDDWVTSVPWPFCEKVKLSFNIV